MIPPYEEMLFQMVVAKITDRSVKLQAACEAVLGQQESRHEQIHELQGHARSIQKMIETINSSLTAFSESLSRDPIDNSIDLFKELQKHSRILYATVNKIPVVRKTNHALACVRKTTEHLAYGSSGSELLSLEAAESIPQEHSEENKEERKEEKKEEIREDEQEGFIENCDSENDDA